MKNLMILCAFFLLATGANAQEQKKVEEVAIQTSAKCYDCKGRIEDALNYTKGVKFAELDNDTKIVTVRFKTKHITLARVKEVISEAGYDADEVKGLQAAIDKLPNCCKPSLEAH